MTDTNYVMSVDGNKYSTRLMQISDSRINMGIVSTGINVFDKKDFYEVVSTMRSISTSNSSLIENINAAVESYMHTINIKTRIDYCFWSDIDYKTKPHSNKKLMPTVMSYIFSNDTVQNICTRCGSLLTCGEKKVEKLTEQLCAANTAFPSMSIDEAQKYLARIYKSLFSSNIKSVGENSKSIIIRENM